jgi:hypothetical protein
MTKFQKCVIIWLVCFGFDVVLLFAAINLAGSHHHKGLGGLAFLSFLAALILTIIFLVRKDRTKTGTTEPG